MIESFLHYCNISPINLYLFVKIGRYNFLAGPLVPGNFRFFSVNIPYIRGGQILRVPRHVEQSVRKTDGINGVVINMINSGD